jgi:hypothetical protein
VPGSQDTGSGPPHHRRHQVLDRRRADLLHGGAQLDAQQL